MSKIFISYRRVDSADVTGRIYDHLCRTFNSDDIFKDVDSIPLGVDFRTIITETVQSCDVAVVIIGKDWLTTINSQGTLRLDDPDDFVRLEVESALKRNIPLIPVLVRGAELPSPGDLPVSLQSLAFRNAIQVRPDPDFKNDVARLVRALEHVVNGEPLTNRHSRLNTAPILASTNERADIKHQDETAKVGNHKECYLIQRSDRLDFVSLYTLLQAVIMGIVGTTVSVFVLLVREDNRSGGRFTGSKETGWLIFPLLFSIFVVPLIVNCGQILWIRRKTSFRQKWILIVANISGFVLFFILIVPVVLFNGPLTESFWGNILGCLCSGIAYGSAQSVGFCFVKRSNLLAHAQGPRETPRKYP